MYPRSSRGFARAALLAALLVCVQSAGAVNILVNPGYETGSLAPWIQTVDYGGATNWTTTTADVHTGAFSAYDQGNKLMVQYFAPIPTANLTHGSVWIKNPHALFNAIYFEYSDATNASGLFATTGQWQHFDFTSWFQPGKSLVAIGVWGYSSGGTTEVTYVDDWIIEAVPEPASLGLLAPLALLVRRRH